MAGKRKEIPRIPEILGVGEDTSNIPSRPGSGSECACDLLSVYMRGGPKYKLGKRTYTFTSPIAMLIPKGTLDNDMQKGRVRGIFALFNGHGLIQAAGDTPGELTKVYPGSGSRVVPCLKELSESDAGALSKTLSGISSETGMEASSQLRRSALLLHAIAMYCDMETRTGDGHYHRAAIQLHGFINELAMASIPMERIYSRLDISAAHAETLFASAFGMTPVAYRKQLRMRRARELLVSSQLNVSETSYAVGYTDPLYFSRIFRKYFSVTPSSLIRDFADLRKENI